MTDIQKGILILLKSALQESTFPLPEGFGLEAAEPVLQRQSLLALGYEGAYRCGVRKDDPVMKRWQQRYFQILLHNERQMYALKQLLSAFEEAGIDHLCVKGSLLKSLYPKPELRPMGDADILIRPEQYDKIRPILETLGFHDAGENEHVYNWKSESLYVELHKTLVPPLDEDYYHYYAGIWQRARKETEFRYCLTAEDHFLFLFTHFARHYRLAGIGCRQILDLYVYRRANPDMNTIYIEGELQKLRLLDFYRNVSRTLEVWFDGVAPDSATELITQVIFSGGNWGDATTAAIRAELSRQEKQGKTTHSKGRSFRNLLFPGIRMMTYRYSVLVNVPCLLPLFWVVRWIEVLLFAPGNIRRRMRQMDAITDESVELHRRALEAVGLDFCFEK